MGIFEKARNIVEANLRQLKDLSHAPRESIKKFILELEQSRREVKFSLSGLLKQEKWLREKMGELEEKLGKWRRRSRLAMKGGREDLARGAEERIKDLSEDREKMRNELEGLKRRLESLKVSIEELGAALTTLKEGKVPPEQEEEIPGRPFIGLRYPDEIEKGLMPLVGSGGIRALESELEAEFKRIEKAGEGPGSEEDGPKGEEGPAARGAQSVRGDDAEAQSEGESDGEKG